MHSDCLSKGCGATCKPPEAEEDGGEEDRHQMKRRKTTGACATPQTGGNFFTAPMLQFAYWEGGAERDRAKWGESLMVKR